MNGIVLKLECLTNLHVGNGDVNYNVVDNEVERDPVTNYPTINSSGVKGALRIFLKDNANCDKWFGSKDSAKNPGELKVLSANMLAMPFRASAGNRAYYLVSTSEMREGYENICTNMNIDHSAISGPNKVEGVMEAEGITLTSSYEIDGKQIYDVKEEQYKNVMLPVLARNCLENGISQNLWYEEVVPHKSIFYVPILAENENLLVEFKNAVDNKVIQFGGNASIGYGLCKVTVG